MSLIIQMLDLHSEFTGETRVWKKVNDETITSTCSTKFPTTLVTGEPSEVSSRKTVGVNNATKLRPLHTT